MGKTKFVSRLWDSILRRIAVGRVAQADGPESDFESDGQPSVEELRTLMTEVLRSLGHRQETSLVRKVHRSEDLSDLWHLRGELMTELARVHGEEQATIFLAKISALFEETLPEGMRSRPSPLS